MVRIFNGIQTVLQSAKNLSFAKKILSFFADFFFRKGIWFTLALVKYFVKTNLIYSVV